MPFDNPAFETDEILKDLQHVKACVSRRWFQGSRGNQPWKEAGVSTAHCLVTATNSGRTIDFMLELLPQPFQSITVWNDKPGRTKAEVIAFLDGCIAAREQELVHAV